MIQLVAQDSHLKVMRGKTSQCNALVQPQWIQCAIVSDGGTTQVCGGEILQRSRSSYTSDKYSNAGGVGFA